MTASIPDELADYRRRQHAEYNTYVAAGPISTPGGTLIYRTGDPIPASSVDAKTGSAVIERHTCAEHPERHCEFFNAPSALSDPGSVVEMDKGQEAKVTQPAEPAPTKAADQKGGKG